MSTGLTGNNIPVGIGYDSNGDPKGFVELSRLSLDYLTMVSAKADLPDDVEGVINRIILRN
jgi:hypothetical protein